MIAKYVRMYVTALIIVQDVRHDRIKSQEKHFAFNISISDGRALFPILSYTL